LIDDADFIELSRIVRRLPPPQRDQLSDWLMDDRLTDMSAECENALRIFHDETPFDFSDLESFDFNLDSLSDLDFNLDNLDSLSEPQTGD
jgi:hypothetical protein